MILLLLAVLIKLFSLNADWVERYYTYGIYPVISRILRVSLGWIPFSMGDLLYIAAFIFLVFKAWKLIRLLARRQVKEYLSWILFRKYLKLVLWIYIDDLPVSCSNGADRFLMAEVTGNYAGLLRLTGGENKFGGGQGI